MEISKYVIIITVFVVLGASFMFLGFLGFFTGYGGQACMGCAGGQDSESARECMEIISVQSRSMENNTSFDVPQVCSSGEERLDWLNKKSIDGELWKVNESVIYEVNGEERLVLTQ